MKALGLTVNNTGTAGGTLNRTTPVPYWTNNTPRRRRGEAALIIRRTGNYAVESPANITPLAGLAKFTIVGWVNCRNNTEGGGGNRVVTWINNGGNGVDLVYKSDGSLQMGINRWPDYAGGAGEPRSTAGKITTDASASQSNWRFFAVTYDSTLSSGHAKYYFGGSAEDATLDVARDYAQGRWG